MDIDESPKSAVQLITGPLRKSRSWKRIQNSNDNTVKPTYTNGKNESSKASNVWYKNLTETNWVKYKSQPYWRVILPINCVLKILSFFTSFIFFNFPFSRGRVAVRGDLRVAARFCKFPYQSLKSSFKINHTGVIGKLRIRSFSTSLFVTNS